MLQKQQVLEEAPVHVTTPAEVETVTQAGILSTLTSEMPDTLPAPLRKEDLRHQPQQMTAEEQKALFEKLQSRTKKARRRFRLMRSFYLGGLSFIFLSMVWLSFHPTFDPRLILVALLAIGVGIGLFMATAIGWRKSANALASLEDIRAVGLLVEGMAAPTDQKNFQATRDALIALLPQLRADDAPLLDASQRRVLLAFLSGRPPFVGVGMLGREGNTRLAVAILQALVQIGDAGALPVVEPLAQGEGMGRDRRIQDAAIICLPFLQARPEDKQDSQQLLRAADGNITPTDMLLRPAQSGASQTEPDQLLRSATFKEEN